MKTENAFSLIAVGSEDQDDINALSNAFSLKAFRYIDVARKARLQQLLSRWPLLQECEGTGVRTLMQVLALQGLHGGCGATALSAALDWALNALQQSVLLIDLSPANQLRPTLICRSTRRTAGCAAGSAAVAAQRAALPAGAGFPAVWHAHASADLNLKRSGSGNCTTAA